MLKTYLPILVVLNACSLSNGPTEDFASKQSPVAQKIEHRHQDPFGERVDPYHWMRDVEWTAKRSNDKNFESMKEEVRLHLEKERAYADAFFKTVENRSKKLFEEMKERIPAKDQGVPHYKNSYWYYTRYEEDSELPIFCRKKDSLENPEEVYLDLNKEYGDAESFGLGHIAVSPNNEILSYSVDTQGNRVYTTFFKNLKTGKLLKQKIERSASGFEWALDSKHFFLNEKDPETLRSHAIYKYDLATLQKKLLYFEKDEEFDVYSYLSRSKKYLFVVINSKDVKEMHLLNLLDPKAKLKVFWPRKPKHRYSLDHYDGEFLIKSNRKNPNYDFLHLDEKDLSGEARTLVSFDADTVIEDWFVSKGYYILEIRKKGKKDLVLVDKKTRQKFTIPQTEGAYNLGLEYNRDPDLSYLRYTYESLTQPRQTIRFDFLEKKKTVLKTRKVGKHYKAENYTSQRIWVESRDKKSVPVTLVYHKDSPPSERSPLLLYGYGSYGYSIDARFSSSVISLLDRSFVYAIAHIRGGSFLGEPWYHSGKFLQKKNSFNDFEDVARSLLAQKMVHPKKLFASGGSAGGLLVGAVVNQAPELFAGVLAQVPFVDVLTTMLDDTLPLTTSEYQEWGNPNEKKYYEYMRSYSPVDQVSENRFPKFLISGSVHDSQVGYWEPAKWVAHLREKQLNKANPIVFDIELNTGHSGKAGRFRYYESEAKRYATLLKWAEEVE